MSMATLTDHELQLSYRRLTPAQNVIRSCRGTDASLLHLADQVRDQTLTEEAMNCYRGTIYYAAY